MGFWDRFRRKRGNGHVQLVEIRLMHEHDWVVVPFRMVEAARVTLHAVTAHPDIPPGVRGAIEQWLAVYEMHLSVWFENTYGPKIFEVLGAITDEVKRLSLQAATGMDEKTAESFRRWEQEMQNRDDES
mgnify:FL=1